MNRQIELFDGYLLPKNDLKVVNVSSVPQRSPFRYPGGKTWLIPVVRQWLRHGKKPKYLIEPFAGGAIVSLTAAFEGLSELVLMSEIDNAIADVWEVILNGESKWFAEKILSFEMLHENVIQQLQSEHELMRERAFCTILKNRVSHGGIMTKGAGIIKNGEKGKGISSRWYPKTLYDRIMAIGLVKDKITFLREDAFDIIQKYKNDTDVAFFIDPPYTKAGKRLYTHSEIDHEQLLKLTSEIKGKYMLTYDYTTEIEEFTKKYNLKL